MTTDDEDARVESLALQARMLEEYYSDLLVRENILTRLLVENRNSISALEAIDESRDMDIAIPIGGGANLLVTLKAAQKVLLNVSSDVAVEKTRSGTIAYLTERTKEVEATLTKLLEQKDEAGSRITVIRNQLNALEMASKQQG